jgi:DcmR-like sensory protein
VSEHRVQFSDGDERALARNVAAFFSQGVTQGEGLVAIAKPGNRAATLDELAARGCDVDAALRDRRLLMFDAEETLARLLDDDGVPDPGHFERVVGGALREARIAAGSQTVRAYGEMVGVLWEAGNTAAAVRLEALWNAILPQEHCSLMCGYPIDVFGAGFGVDQLDEVLCAHTHVISAGTDGRLESAVEQAMDDVLGARSETLRPLMKPNYRPAWASVPRGEAIVLWLRNNLPGTAGEILTRARTYYRTPLSS